MRLLRDTHTFLWLDGSPEHLSPGDLAVCEDPTNQLYLSVVSAWEIQIKHQIHRLQLEVSLEEMIQVDSLLIAQATAEQMWLVSADGQFAPYLVDVIW
jgi:PIN domain nuclease of toxin-antitoxin system